MSGRKRLIIMMLLSLMMVLILVGAGFYVSNRQQNVENSQSTNNELPVPTLPPTSSNIPTIKPEEHR